MSKPIQTFLQWKFKYCLRRDPELKKETMIWARSIEEAFSDFYKNFNAFENIIIIDMQLYYTQYSYWITYYDADKDFDFIYEHYCKTKSELFNEISNNYAFNDLGMQYDISNIRCDFEPVYYIGWQPGMTYEYHNNKGEVVWKQAYPEWDH